MTQDWTLPPTVKHRRAGYTVRTAAWALAGVVWLSPMPVSAVDVPTSNPPLEDLAMRQAREAVSQKAWEQALTLLQGHLRAAPDDADGHNLLGYSLRHLGRHAESLAAYERALALNPAHLGAHEYLGELFLQTGQRARALRQLQILADLCQAQCEEYQELKQAIEQRPQ
ncbi:MAG: tetratricopeptide repeat protein [Rubrivivax sp.]